MKKVITYGTFDLLHYGHIRLLERAKALGDYLIVGVTADDFDKIRGKINTKQALCDRIEAVKDTGLADKIIVEEYEGQKIDDVIKYGVDVFAIGSDWKGKFDYLNQYCKVVYLERTYGISSTKLRESEKQVKLGYLGNDGVIAKYFMQTPFINGLVRGEVFTDEPKFIQNLCEDTINFAKNENEFFNSHDAVYVVSGAGEQYTAVKKCLSLGKSVLCESLPCRKASEYEELVAIAKDKDLCFMTALKTAYAVAYHRLLLLVKTGIIGEVVSVEATCTSLTKNTAKPGDDWNGIYEWGPVALLPVFQILGTDYKSKQIVTQFEKDAAKEKFATVKFTYDSAVASVFVSKSVKSEGQLIVSGTKGCIYVPAPWWKTDYFEIHFENQNANKRFFYQLDGDGLRNLLLQFYANVVGEKDYSLVNAEMIKAIVGVIQDFDERKDTVILGKAE